MDLNLFNFEFFCGHCRHSEEMISAASRFRFSTHISRHRGYCNRHRCHLPPRAVCDPLSESVRSTYTRSLTHLFISISDLWRCHCYWCYLLLTPIALFSSCSRASSPDSLPKYWKLLWKWNNERHAPQTLVNLSICSTQNVCIASIVARQ